MEEIKKDIETKADQSFNFDMFTQYPMTLGQALMPQSLYYYYIDDHLMGKGVYGKILVPPTDAVISCVYVPYMRRGELTLSLVKYDTKRFPLPAYSDDLNFAAESSYLQRIQDQHIADKTVGDFKPYKIVGKNVGGKRDWRNEGKLWQYPYHFSILYDGISEPLEVRPHLCYDKDTANVCIRTPLNPSGQYTMYVEQYKEDLKGVFEGSTSVSSLQLPLVSSAYTDFMSRNKSQVLASKQSAIATGTLGVAAAVAGVAAAPVTGGVSLATAGAVLAGTSAITNSLASVNSSLAQERDLAQSPGNLRSLGNDLMFDLGSIGTINRFSLNLYRVKTEEEHLKKLGDYFAMFGYRQNKVMKPNERSRYYYNYIKTSGCNISCIGNEGIPKEHFNKIKAIYDSGVTVWHIDRNGCHVGDYSMDNYETE